MKKSNSILDGEKASFEKARFDYCWKMYEEENQRKDTLEKKSQFYLSIITLVLGGIFLNLDFINTLREVLSQRFTSSLEKLLILLPLVSLFLSIFIALIAVLKTLQVREYTRPYPAKTVSSYFAPGSNYFEDETSANLFKVTAIDIAVALEVNRGLNDKKTKWVDVISVGLISATISLAIFLLVVIVF